MSYHDLMTVLRLGAKKAPASAASLSDLDSEEGIMRYICLKSLEERGVYGPDGDKKALMLSGDRLS